MQTVKRGLGFCLLALWGLAILWTAAGALVGLVGLGF
jgi:hypothetical protein